MSEQFGIRTLRLLAIEAPRYFKIPEQNDLIDLYRRDQSVIQDNIDYFETEAARDTAHAAHIATRNDMLQST